MKLLFHGNLESERDWSFLGNGWRVFPLWKFLREKNPTDWSSFINLLRDELQSWRTSFEHVAGYSLGGRILLGLLDEGFLSPRVTFFSTHPGLKTEEERRERLWQDLQWKEKLLLKDWKEVCEEWNLQDVFAGDLETVPKFELEEYRREIAHAFDLLSLGRMPNFWEKPLPFPPKCMWICGERDQKFSLLGEAFCREKSLKFQSFPEHGHRLHKQSPLLVAKLLS